MNGIVQVERLQQRLDNTLTRRPKVSADIEVQADFAKYFCVLVSGFLENAIIAIVLDLVERRHSPQEISRFIQRQLKYWTNPNCDKISQLLGRFNHQWQVKVEEYLVDERKEAINSLVALRHKIAHGESVGTSLVQVKGYYEIILHVVSFISDLVRSNDQATRA